MKTFALYAALGVALAASVPALAEGNDQPAGVGHYEWNSIRTFGPHSVGPLRQRVWVPDSTEAANCACDMMRMSSADAAGCMKGLHSILSPSGTSAS
jgi:hypothetical protein